jgi:hypothetical protein
MKPTQPVATYIGAPRRDAGLEGAALCKIQEMHCGSSSQRIRSAASTSRARL